VLLVRLVAGAGGGLQGAFVVIDRDVSMAALLGISITMSGLALIVGILTPAAAAALAASLAALLVLFASEPVTPFGSAAVVLIVANALALVLVGPGAYSVDARLFGRREIRIPGDAPQDHD
jgi:putative oxidoreductase